MLNYIKACINAFLFYQVKRQDLQGKKILAVNEKYYVARKAVFGGADAGDGIRSSTFHDIQNASRDKWAGDSLPP